MAIATQDTTMDLSHWAPGTSFWNTDDGHHFIVMVDELTAPEGSRVMIRRQPTVILYTDSTTIPEDMTPDFTFDPGTDAHTAVTAAGFTVAES